MFEPVPAAAAGLIALLDSETLPTSDLGKPNRFFWSRIAHGEVVGYVGLEFYGDAALLRSLVVQPGYKGKGYGADLVGHAIEQAKSRGVSTLWLLTKTARPFFEHLGWQVTERAAAPLAVAQSDEFAGLCPVSATCLSTRI